MYEDHPTGKSIDEGCCCPDCCIMREKIEVERENMIDCRSEEGITIGLIDAIISISRILAKRDLDGDGGVADALEDLRSDEDLMLIIGLEKS